jgi:hypothetical protein
VDITKAQAGCSSWFYLNALRHIVGSSLSLSSAAQHYKGDLIPTGQQQQVRNFKMVAAKCPLAPVMTSLLLFAFLLSGAGASR